MSACRNIYSCQGFYIVSDVFESCQNFCFQRIYSGKMYTAIQRFCVSRNLKTYKIFRIITQHERSPGCGENNIKCNSLGMINGRQLKCIGGRNFSHNLKKIYQHTILHQIGLPTTRFSTIFTKFLRTPHL